MSFFRYLDYINCHVSFPTWPFVDSKLLLYWRYVYSPISDYLYVEITAHGIVTFMWEVLIYQLHLPYVISNSMQALCALSHS